MPKKKTTPAEEPMQVMDGLPGQDGIGLETSTQDAPQEGAFREGSGLEMGAPDGAVSGELPEAESPSEDAQSFPVDGAGDTPEVMNVEASVPTEPFSAVHDDKPPMEPREYPSAEGVPAEDIPPYGQAGEGTPPPGPVSADEAPPAPAPPMTDRQSFFALDFREMDRGLTAEEHQAWNSIYASFRGHSALSETI